MHVPNKNVHTDLNINSLVVDKDKNLNQKSINNKVHCLWT